MLFRSEAELIFMALAEMAVRQIAEGRESNGYEANIASAECGGKIARTSSSPISPFTP